MALLFLAEDRLTFEKPATTVGLSPLRRPPRHSETLLAIPGKIARRRRPWQSPKFAAGRNQYEASKKSSGSSVWSIPTNNATIPAEAALWSVMIPEGERIRTFETLARPNPRGSDCLANGDPSIQHLKQVLDRTQELIDKTSSLSG